MKKTLFLLLLNSLFSFFTMAQVNLPITWDDTTITYTFTDFDGTSSSLVADPTNVANTVLKTDKSPAGQPWQGTTITSATGLTTAIPFAQGSTTISAVVYSPDAGIQVRLKVEDSNNPNISVETEATTTVANAWDTLVFDFANQASGTAAINFANTYNKISIFYDFFNNPAATKTYYVDEVFFGGGNGGSTGPQKAQIDLPISWDDTANVDYTVIDFDGTASMLTADPSNASNMVLKTDKSPAGQPWQGTTLSTTSGLATSIPFAAGATTISAVVYSPDSGIQVRLKVEDSNNGNISVETEATTMVANAWDTLVFDFANQVSGTAAINFANTYDKATIFYDFFNNPAATKTYYVDAVFFGSGNGGSTGPQKAQIDLPISWDDTANVDYTVIDFDGTASMLIADPSNPSNMVLKTDKSPAGQPWQGTTLSTTSGLATAIPFAAGATTISAVVYSPDSGIQVRLKVEDSNNGNISVETEATTMVANAWDTLVFDFANQVSGTAAINFANTYDKATIFYDFFNNPAATKTYYVDAVFFGSGNGGSTGPQKAQIDLPISWDDTANVDYTVIDFDGTASMLTADPSNASNMVLKTDKSPAGQPWQGTTLSTTSGLATAIPFAAGATTISAVVYSPDSGIQVRLKVEDSNNGNISVETEVTTMVANAWDTLVFDFANQVSGTAAINFANTYDKATIFYDFFNNPAATKTYYVDAVFFGGGNGGSTGPQKAQIDLPISWDDTANVDYTVIDFDGTASMLTADPSNASNMVLKTDKSPAGQPWQGTTLSTTSGLATAIPFAAGATTISAVVYSPDAGIPVRLKAEDSNNPNISVETEALTSVANAWDTLVFDFSNHASGTSAINFANTYNKVSIFYDFFNNPAATKTYYLDAVFFGGSGTPPPAQDTVEITFNVNMALTTPAATGVYLAGGASFGVPGDNEMLDPDNDGIYTITVKRIKGFSGHYTFTNGNCSDWSCKENIAGLPCADPSNFNDRFMPQVMKDTVISTCFGACTTDGTCPQAPDTANVTFTVDMRESGLTFTQMYVTGNLGISDWGCGTCNPLDDSDNDNVWTTTLRMPKGTFEYKFTYDNWAGQETFDPTTGDSICTITTGTFTNRLISVSADYSTPIYCWESCDPCSTISVAEVNQLNDISIYALAGNKQIQVYGYSGNNTIINVFDILGKPVIEATNLTGNQAILDLGNVANGIYIVTVQDQNQIKTQKVLVR